MPFFDLQQPLPPSNSTRSIHYSRPVSPAPWSHFEVEDVAFTPVPLQPWCRAAHDSGRTKTSGKTGLTYQMVGRLDMIMCADKDDLCHTCVGTRRFLRVSADSAELFSASRFAAGRFDETERADRFHRRFSDPVTSARFPPAVRLGVKKGANRAYAAPF